MRAGQGTLEASVTLGDPHATFQQAPNRRSLNQTHFLSHTESASGTCTLMASLLCYVRTFSVLPMTLPAECILTISCGTYKRLEEALFNFLVVLLRWEKWT